MARRSSSIRNLPVNAGLMLLSVAVVLVVGEGVARLVSHFDESPPPASLPPKWKALPTLKGIDALTRPNVRGIFTGTLYETNRAGLRGPWRPRRKPSGVFRVVLIGDSFSMGSGVLYEDSYAALLDRMLKEKRHGQRYQVINVAMAGLATVGVMNRFENVGLRYDPDLVIYGYTINDIEGPDYRHTAEPELRDPHRFRDSRSHLIRAVGPRWFSLIELVAAPPGTYTYELDDNYFSNEAAFQKLLDGLDRLAQKMEQRGTCGVVFIHTQFWALNMLHPYRRHYAIVKAAAEERDLFAVESHPYLLDLVGSDALSYWVSPSDSHPNAAGHARYAQALWDGLEELPDTCWQRRRRWSGSR